MKSLKGQAGALTGLVMLIVMMVAAVGLIVYALGSTEVVNEYMTDLNVMTRASYNGDYLTQNFGPRAGELSQFRGAYLLGQDDSKPSFTVGEAEPKSTMNTQLDTKSTEILDSYTSQAVDMIACSGELGLEMNTGKDESNVTDDGDQNWIECSGRNSKTRYVMIGVEHDLRGIPSYYEIAELLAEWFDQLDSNIEQVKATGEASSCKLGSISSFKDKVEEDAKVNAKDNALEDYRDKAENLFEGAKAENPSEFDLINLDEMRFQNYEPPFDDPDGAQIISSDEDDCCPGSSFEAPDSDGCCTEVEDTQDGPECVESALQGNEYEAEAEYELEEVTVLNTLENGNREILTENGAEYLLFTSEYTHEITN